MKLDLHVHTSKSPCSNLTLEKVTETALKKGISCVAICDHDIPFDEREITDVKDKLEKKFSIVINPETRCDNEFYIIPGIELSTPSGHVLRLFTEDTGSPITVLVHPFEHKSYSDEVYQNHFDLVETASARANYKRKSANDDAERLARKMNVLFSAGSDAHFEDEIGNAYMEINENFQGLDELKKCILDAERTTFYKNSKKVFVAKSQLLKNRRLNRVSIKAYLFYIYCVFGDLRDKICQK